MAATKKPKPKPKPKPTEPKRKVGRPTKRTKEVEEAIFRALRSGVAYRSACHIAGVTPNAVDEWRRLDQDFCAAIEKAKGNARARVAASMFDRAVSANDTTAAIWWMKCQDPEFREPRDKNIVVPLAKAIRDQAGIAEAIFAIANQVLAGKVSPHALRDVVTALGDASTLLERVDIETRLAKIEQNLDAKEPA